MHESTPRRECEKRSGGPKHDTKLGRRGRDSNEREREDETQETESGDPVSGRIKGYNKENDGAQAGRGAEESKQHRHHHSAGASRPPHGPHARS